jgi:formate C-acetyltransferase
MSNGANIRISSKTPTEFLVKVAEVFSVTSGPAIFNDEVVISALVGCGYSLEDARDYAIIGCVEPTSDGNTFGCTSGNDISLVGILEMVLTNGSIHIIGKKVGLETGNPKNFNSFGELIDAYKKQLAHCIEFAVKYVNIKDKVYAESFHNPYVSSTLLGCVENALDMTCGGAKYNFSSISGRGLGTVADSLAVIKKLVFEEKALTMNELIDAINNNYNGKENIRQLFLNRAPKYGNDNDFADNIAKDIAEMFCDEVSKHSTIRGGIFRPSFFSYGMHVVEGSFLGATPNGRRAGEAVSNSISPSNGVEMKGPTAILKSCSKINHRKISNGCALNLKLLPSFLRTEGGIKNLAFLIKTYFDLGGMEVQLNVVDNKVLRDAQKNPEKYKDLVVRVSGYSAYFVDLGKSIQDDIINRTEFGGV